MSKPFNETEIVNEQQIVDDAKRVARMFGNIVKLGELLGPLVSIKRACNEADTRLLELRDEEEKLKASVDFHKATLTQVQDEVGKALAEKQGRLDNVDKQIALRQAELDSLLTKRDEFLKSIGAK